MKKRGPAPRLIRHPLERAVDDGRTGARPERLVGFGFRCWLRGLRTGEAALWQLAWREYSGALGPAAARPVLDRLSGWVLAVDCEAARRVDTHPPGCLGFCRDECLAISMVAACQHNACPAMRACAFALLGAGEAGRSLASAASFAAGLAEIDQRLSAASICDAVAVLPTSGSHH
jgi:hypothetical protein